MVELDAALRAADDARLNVWARQPKKFFNRATIDLDGTPVVTTGEVPRLVNRSGNRPSREGAADEADEAIDVCRRGGFRQIVLRGDTAFSQSAKLDAWDAAAKPYPLAGLKLLDATTCRGRNDGDGLPPGDTRWDKCEAGLTACGWDRGPFTTSARRPRGASLRRQK